MSFAEGGGAVLIRDPEACGGREMGHCWGKAQGGEEGKSVGHYVSAKCYF